MLCFGIYNSAPLSSFFETFPLMLMMMLFGLGLSIPALWLYSLLFRELKESTTVVFVKKLILAVVGASFIWITFYLFDRNFFKNASLYSLTWPGIYTVVLFVSTFIFRMDDKTTDESQYVETLPAVYYTPCSNVSSSI
jgi:predicted tellurium resistance membrane protein TerC